jgi:hypothetical protein
MPPRMDRSGRTKHRCETPCSYPSCGGTQTYASLRSLRECASDARFRCRPRPRPAEPLEAPRRGRRLPRLPALEGCDTARVRSRQPGLDRDVRRRAAGRPRGPGGGAVRGARGSHPRRRVGVRRHRPSLRLRHERGQALQVGAARKASHPCETELERARSLPSVARSGARGRAPERARLLGRDGGAVVTRPPVPRHEAARRVDRIRPG